MSHSFRFLNVNRCTIETHKEFGPTNAWCYGGFDFTLFFEETLLSLVPFALVFPFLVVRLYRLHKASIVVDGGRWHFAKQVSITFRYGYLLLTLLFCRHFTSCMEQSKCSCWVPL